MDRFSKDIDICIILLLLNFFCIYSFIYFNLGKNIMLNFIMLGSLFMVTIVAYFRGIVEGFLFSAMIIFFYVTFIIYNNTIHRNPVELITYIWMVDIPLSAFISGKLSENINLIQSINTRLQKEYRDLITIDKTTGLSNLKGFYIDLDREMSKAKRHKLNLSLMIVKIQYYDELNAILGEKKMEEILKIISNVITLAIRGEDISYKLNKDTFAILMPSTNLQGAEVVKNRIKESISEENLKIKQEDKNVNIDIKVGIVEYKNTIKEAFEFKELAEKELEYDV
ncbi:GGDEF domain-containing protein [Clostridium botulinum]|uniref:GGDEF domain-containing protein n=2 Tax=Clostridium botulinum TaxID=1491 RepID=A0A846I309_CLOBO|nr:GGDEF domain-containing protein [Clostridium botulinum]AJD26156.1 diguanylate cyclase domain protein [Clostridium botulinum CDC_297]ACQ53125.1 GGDEF domain protein [Clostridium botulinum Ba4 str. 657]AJE12316.1 diguanylate cyclase domain protein [Clostridium botulinum CDC_1436]APQ99150.1 diguanylate cyclase domain protein [Clostridium botulinum]APU60179.1 diguanylate cyclase domain protein [Clostridium botulinum]